MEGFGARLIDVAGFQISETILVTWLIMALIIGLAIIARIAMKNFETIPTGKQNVIESIVEAINNLTIGTMGENNKSYAPYIGTIIIFIAFANLSGLFGLKPPTSDINTTLGLGVMSFILIQRASIKNNGIFRHIKGYFEPMFVLFPMNILGDVALPISLAFRLFGNIIGGVIIGSLMYGALASLSAAVGLSTIPIFQAFIPVVAHVYFDLFSGLLQSFIFTMLTMVFLSIATE